MHSCPKIAVVVSCFFVFFLKPHAEICLFILEITKKEIDVVSVPGKGGLLVHEPKQKVDLTKYLDNQIFQFDYSFDETTTNDLVYK